MQYIALQNTLGYNIALLNSSQVCWIWGWKFPSWRCFL